MSAEGLVAVRGNQPAAHFGFWQRALMLKPVAAAMSYPYWLAGFHAAVQSEDGGGASRLMGAVCLAAAFAVPLIGIVVATWVSRPNPQRFIHIRARRMAFLSVCAPPLFVLFGVGLGLLNAPFEDTTLWLIVWAAAGVYVATGRATPFPPTVRALPKVRVAHGIVAFVLLVFIAFHLTNHLTGWLGADAHGEMMRVGRTVYRSAVGEVALLSLLLAQIALGSALVWRWSVFQLDRYRVFQIASGDYLAVFILTHLNSALISARAVRGAETDWAWATGAPEGLLLDPWNIRLLPHYAFAVFFVLAHLASGLRQVMLAHAVAPRLADRTWLAGLVIAAGVAILIALALCGTRWPA